MVRLAVVVMGLVLVAQAAQAQAVSGPQALAEAMQSDPDGFTSMAEDVIAGFAGAGGLTPAGIEEYIALERAAARAGAMRRLMAMDLDNDGSVVEDELAVAMRAASAGSRGRMERQFRSTDTNGDRVVDAAEIRAEGQAAALRSLTEDEALMLRAMLGLDGDGDGALTLAELRAAMQQVRDAS